MSTKIKAEIKIEDYLSAKKDQIDNHLRKLLCESNCSEGSILWDAIKYSLFNGGKRIRGILCIAAYESIKELLNNKDDFTQDSLSTSCSLELIHTMSLIHDDLPCMDNDDLRRGKPSCHKAFDEAIAILAGDAMLSLAFYFIAENTKNISLIQKNELIKILSSVFSFGLVPGQIMDLFSTNKKNINSTTIEKISRLKTAELIKGSILSGVIIALDIRNKNDIYLEPNKSIIEKLSDFGTKIGLAFQITDDILDTKSDSKIPGKTSYPLLHGIENAKIYAQNLSDSAKSILENTGAKSPSLYKLSEYIINRTC